MIWTENVPANSTLPYHHPVRKASSLTRAHRLGGDRWPKYVQGSYSRMATLVDNVGRYARGETLLNINIVDKTLWF
jgi:hypothetical protein